MDLHLQGEVIIVTGGGSGIGAAITEVLAVMLMAAKYGL